MSHKRRDTKRKEGEGHVKMEAENGVTQPQTKESLEPPVEEEGLPGATSERGEEYLEPPVEEA